MDLSKIDRLEERQRIAAHKKQVEAISKECDDAMEPVREQYRKAILEIEARHDNEMDEAHEPFEAQLAEIAKPFEDRLNALEQPIYAKDQIWGDDHEIAVCGLTGLPLFLGDDVLEDQNTGELYLKAALIPKAGSKEGGGEW